MEKSETNVVALRSPKEAKKQQREALHKLLSRDDEYTNMGDHVLIDATIEENIDKEVAAETQIGGIKDIMKLVYLDTQGYGTQAISTAMKLTSEDVAAIRRSESFKIAKDAVLAEIMAMSRRMMEVTAMKAVKTLTECMDSKNDKIKLSAAVEVLNRTGLSATQKIELTTTNNTMVNFTEDELAEIIRSSNAIPVNAEVITDGNK